MVTRDELAGLGFKRGTDWPQETWVYDGIVWVAFAPLSGEWSRFKDVMNNQRWGPRCAFESDEIDAEALRGAVEAVSKHEADLSANYQGDD